MSKRDPQTVEKPSGLLTLDEARTRLGISIPQVAYLLGISESHAYSMAARGDIPCLRLAGRQVANVPALLQMFGLEAPK